MEFSKSSSDLNFSTQTFDFQEDAYYQKSYNNGNHKPNESRFIYLTAPTTPHFLNLILKII